MIRQILEEGRREVVDQGRHFMIWGVVAGAGCLATWLAVTGALALPVRWVWLGLLTVGWTASMLAGWREERAASVRNVGRRMLSVVWITSAVTLTLIGLCGMFGSVVPAAALSGLVAVVLGGPLAATARLTGERWLNGVAVGWWAGGAVMLLVPGSYHLLLLAGMAVVLLAVPGMVLHMLSRQSAVATAARS